MKRSKIQWIIFGLFFIQRTIPAALALGVDFTERVTFNKDGSGSFSFKIDLKKSRKLIAFIQYISQEYRDMIQCIDPLQAVEIQCKNIPDIIDVYSKNEKQKHRFTLKFRFKTVEALNKAMLCINQGIDPVPITYFTFSDELFVREDINGIVRKLIYYQQHGRCLIKSLDLAFFFKGTTYTTIYTFPNRIKDFTNPLSLLAKDEKTIYITHYILAADETIESIGNRLHFYNQQI